MNAYRLAIKLYLDSPFEGDLAPLVPIFHRWIQSPEVSRNLDPEDLLIDVADYSHVPDGPGVMLIAHGAHYSLDATDGELGLLYARKRHQPGDFHERLAACWGRVDRAAQALEAEAVGLRFSRQRWALRIQDRLLAPANEETFAAVEPALRELVTRHHPDLEVELVRETDVRGGFGIQAYVRQPALLATG